MPRRTIVDPRFSARLRELRQARGLSLRELARIVPCSHVHVYQIEQGRNSPSPELAARLDNVLDTGGELAGLFIGDDELGGGPASAASVAARRLLTVDRILATVRAGLVARRWPEPATDPVKPADMAAGARAAHDAYQRADYAEVGRLLPGVLAAGEQLVQHSSGLEQRQAHRLLAVAKIAASKLVVKLGDGELAWIAAEQAASSAALAEDAMVGSVAAYQIACALLSLPDRLDDAAQVITVASDELQRRGEAGDPVDVSARGALLLLGAIVAARHGDCTAASRHLDRADQFAARLGGDANHLWTGFGPTNLMIHQVSIAVGLRRPWQAIQIGDRLDTSRMPAVLVSRRAQVHLDLAAAYAQTAGGDSSAVLHLLEVERIAPQIVGAGRTSRTLLVKLVGRERRSATPGLRAFAARAGVLT